MSNFRGILRIFNDIFYLDDDDDDQSNSLFDFVDNSKLDIVQQDNKITNISSLNLEEDPEIQEDIKSTKIENLLEKLNTESNSGLKVKSLRLVLIIPLLKKKKEIKIML